MTKRGKTNFVPFIAEYEDGSKCYFDVDIYTLKSGDHVARLIAGEKQREGHLPPGNIVRVSRDWETYLSQK